MTLLLLLAFGFVFNPTPMDAPADDDMVAAEMKKFKGTWEPIENVLDGVPTP